MTLNRASMTSNKVSIHRRINMRNQQIATLNTIAVELKAGNVAAPLFNTAVAQAVSTVTGTAVAPVAFALVKTDAEELIFNVGQVLDGYINGQLTVDAMVNSIYGCYEAIAMGTATPMTEVDVVRYESAKEIAALKAQMAQVNTNQTIQGGSNMNTVAQPEITKEVLFATYAAGNMTADQLAVALKALDNNNSVQPQAQGTVAQSVGNLVQGTTTAVGQLAVGSVNAVGDLLNSLMGVGTQAVGSVTGAVGNVDLKAKAGNVVNGTLDNAHVLVGNTINTGVQVGAQAIKVGGAVGQTAVSVTANIAGELIKATEEIANTLLGGLGQTAHTVNNAAYFTGKKVIGNPVNSNPKQFTDAELDAMFN